MLKNLVDKSHTSPRVSSLPALHHHIGQEQRPRNMHLKALLAVAAFALTVNAQYYNEGLEDVINAIRYFSGRRPLGVDQRPAYEIFPHPEEMDKVPPTVEEMRAERSKGMKHRKEAMRNHWPHHLDMMDRPPRRHLLSISGTNDGLVPQGDWYPGAEQRY